MTVLRIFRPIRRTSRPLRSRCGACVYGPQFWTKYNYFAPCFYGQRSPLPPTSVRVWDPAWGKRLFISFPKRLCRLWGPHSLIFHGYGDSFLGVKWPGREANHTPPFSAKSKMSGTVPLFRLYVSIAQKGEILPFLWVWNLVSFMRDI
jgi:hypothetical protein